MPILLELTVPGDAVPKERPRKDPRTGHMYTPPKTRDAEEKLRAKIDVQVLQRRQQPYPGPVGVRLTLWMEKARRTKGDGDNAEKLIFDCLQRGRRAYGGVILNDNQIDECHWRIRRAVPGEAPRTEIVVYTLDDEPAP